MKNKFNLLVGILFLALAFVACSDDDDDDDSVNYLKVGDTSYEITQGGIFLYGETSTSGVYNIDLDLVTEGLDISNDTITGEGNVLDFELFMSSETSLVPGTYTYSSTANVLSSYDYGVCLFNYNAAVDQADSIAAVTGPVTIVQDGSEYEISIDCTDSNNNKVTGYYKGTLITYDEREN